MREWTVMRMTNGEAINWIINLTADIGKAENQHLWHYEQALTEIRGKLESAPYWIPCSERLPDESKWYLISNGLDTWVAIWSKENKEWLSVTGLDYTITDVTAWMAFPEPPKEET